MTMPGSCRLLSVALLLVPALAQAQVGHDPARSPYRDLSRGVFLAPAYSAFQGDGGTLGILPNSGPMVGVRAEVLGNRPFTLGAEFATGTLQRLIVDADDPVATRVTGPVDQRVNMLGVNLILNLTGAKTWHNLAPYAGSGAGFISAAKVLADTSGWNFGTRFYFAPTIGARYFLLRDVYLRAEARAIFVQVRYPNSYRDEPSRDPGTGGESNAVLPNGPFKEWVTSGIYTVGIGIPFPWPF